MVCAHDNACWLGSMYNLKYKCEFSKQFVTLAHLISGWNSSEKWQMNFLIDNLMSSAIHDSERQQQWGTPPHTHTHCDCCNHLSCSYWSLSGLFPMYFQSKWGGPKTIDDHSNQLIISQICNLLVWNSLSVFLSQLQRRDYENILL